MTDARLIKTFTDNQPSDHKDESRPISLNDFIEKPSHQCTEQDYKDGIKQVLTMLDQKPSTILDIMVDHPYIAVTFLLDDLADKMKKHHCIDKLAILFDKCLDQLVETSIYNLHDLARCLSMMPSYSDKVMDEIFAKGKEHRVKRIVECNGNPEQTLKEITEKYSNYKNKFEECYKVGTAPADKKKETPTIVVRSNAP